MEIQIRLARQCDMRSILEMSKGIYECYDYFPHVFLRWLDDSKRRILVAEKGGVIIGLRAFHVVDEDSTVVSRSLRVHPEYRRQGVSALLIRAQKEYIQAYFQSVRTERYMVSSANVARLAIGRKALDSLSFELGFVAYFVDPAKLSTRFQNSSSCPFSNQTSVNDAPVVAPLSFDEFRHLFKERKLDGVVWNNTLVVDCEAFQAHHPSNLSNGLLMHGDFLLASTRTGSGAVESLSHLRHSPMVKHYRYIVTMYTSDEVVLKMHIAKQLEYVVLQRQAAKEMFVFSCYLPKSLLSCARDYLSNDFSLEYVDFFDFNILLFENDKTYM